MEIHLDTSFLIRSLLAGTAESRSLDRWVRQGETIKISAMVWAEFLCGPVKVPDAPRSECSLESTPPRRGALLIPWRRRAPGTPCKSCE
jgi:predicted nucleic acid-binding protein